MMGFVFFRDLHNVSASCVTPATFRIQICKRTKIDGFSFPPYLPLRLKNACGTHGVIAIIRVLFVWSVFVYGSI